MAKLFQKLIVVLSALSALLVSQSKNMTENVFGNLENSPIVSISTSENCSYALVKLISTGIGEGRYEAGDIVEVRDCLKPIGKEEKEKFLIVKLPPIQDKNKYIETVSHDSGGVLGVSNRIIDKRRRYGININNFLSEDEFLNVIQKGNKIIQTDERSFILKQSQQAVTVLPNRVLIALERREKINKFLTRIKNNFVAYAATTNTKTVKPSGGDYASLNAWEAGRQSDLVANDYVEIAELYAMSDTTGVIIDGWTTDATRYIKIYTPTSERHDGKWDTSAYRLVTNVHYSASLQNTEDFVRIEGLQIEQTTAYSDGGHAFASTLGASGDLQLSYNIVRFTGVVADQGAAVSGFYLTSLGASATVKVWNNISYNFKRGMNVSQNSDYTKVLLYSNTIYAGTGQVGLNWGGEPGSNGNTAKAKNMLINGAGTNYNVGLNAYVAKTYTTNLSEDTTGPNAALRSRVVIFVDEANYDLHLDPTDTNAMDDGTSLSADADLAFSDDIDGVARSGTWDVGADEYVAPPAAGGSGEGYIIFFE